MSEEEEKALSLSPSLNSSPLRPLRALRLCVKSSEIPENTATFLQSAMWGEFKSRFGWSAKTFLVEWEQETVPLLVLSRRLAPGFSFAYVPWGPELPQDIHDCCKPRVLHELAKTLKPFLARNTAFIRFDPPWEINAEFLLSSSGFKRAAADIQPPDTVVIDLSATCDEILAAMKTKWRYNINLAEKKGVKVLESGKDGLEKFYSLLKETAQRDGIAVHNFDYYKTLFDICREKEIKIKLYTASHETDVLAAIVVLFYRDEATYLYGASSNEKRNLMAVYALQWKAMQDAKQQGCKYYDLFGIPPDDNPNHPMAGLYRFKTGFGGKIIHRPGSWDFRYKPVIYSLFNAAEALRKKIRDHRKNFTQRR